MSKKKKELRSGITTGASAAAAAKAATALLFEEQFPAVVTVFNPAGQAIAVPVARLEKTAAGTRAVVIKDGGDDPDVTHGMEIVVNARPAGEGIDIRGGTGVGRMTRPGLQVPVGEAAINPVPRRMIMAAAAAHLPADRGVTLTVSIPGGEEAARRTLNPRLGITGGLSILGTTGIVRPMSEEAFKDSLVPLVRLAVAHGHRQVLLTPGRLGERMAVEGYGFPAEAVVEMSNFVGFMLDTCVEQGIKEVLLWGHHGKLIKVAAGIFHTHSRLADGRRETLASHAALLGAGPDLVACILEANTVESVIEELKQHQLMDVFKHLAGRASRRAEEYVRGRLKVGTVMLSMDGRVLGLDETALMIGRELGCRQLA
ncbi:cobalt-precorrin-5B (C(1))-methyltransferase CbiD [Desulfotomaculum copahuensis]|uniref:Cobalt-precorrin-5B C(1)-methyltransferase n=1 Tax=Desulfotomaculum copahuensis TaxID=1838280 RepID=A0A1B7LC26_9FIRM|nr:cobalt-precorrin-5B (C(1))-methyltransferase CbiD [Desulfotomaculum copahuensis]OAT80272.1 cobalamin biosynthesis protein CbiD [Desulfotomaculum copahuensis]